MSSRRQSLDPLVVKLLPNNRPSNIAPCSPPSPTPKRVSFAPKADDKLSRPLTSTEAWSLYYFENHARHCPDCYNPHEVYRRTGRLCEIGHGLAQDVACHVYHQGGEVYSTRKDDSKLVRVEIPHGYAHLRGLLQSMAREIRHRTTPILSYDKTYPVPARKSWTPDSQPEIVTVESAISSSPKRRSIHRPVRYSTVVIDNDVEDVTAVRRPQPQPQQLPLERRGSLYEQRKKQDYRVEIREPSDKKDRRRRERRDSGFWM
ncbi:Hypothetical predicted protein [Lecanosticta acicola]|uniref:Uncharacterized protein n=1 Tax=Lecanosticta acicola TaxID=111012 RepID=A0AAI8YUJ5_9PEZI|nr:Hypothetical predicted protein [Lecanosticta acicola]